jgi:hypothetical protein
MVFAMSDEQRAQAADACLRCGGAMTSMGVEKLRVGGTSGGWQLLFGSYAELSEETLPLEAFACGQCHRVELRVPTS